MKNQTDTLQTSDLKTVAFLLTKGISLIGVERKDPRKVIFCVQNTPEVKQLLDSYWKNLSVVNPRILFENLDYLKDLIHRDYDF